MRRLFLYGLMLWGLNGLNAWETAISGVTVTAPAQGKDGRIYSCADDRSLHCLDAQSGKEYWSYRAGRRLKDFTVVSPDGRIFICTVRDRLICISPGGWELWTYQLAGELVVPPAVDTNGTVYLLGADGVLCCLDRQGRNVWAFQSGPGIREIFALERGVLLMGTGNARILNTDGTLKAEGKLTILKTYGRSSDLIVLTGDGTWGRLDTESLEIEPGESPLKEGTRFPDEGVLITYEGRLVSGRKDWFMQALDAGESAFDPYYQSGGSPLRNRGFDGMVASESNGYPPSSSGERSMSYKNKGGNPLMPLITADPVVLNRILKRYENVESLPQLLAVDYNYDLTLSEILSEGNRVSADVYRPRTDNYSRNRIYKILTRWGDLRLRETLILLAGMEEDTLNLSLIMEGLGRIGADDDGRSMDAVRSICARNAKDTEILNAGVINAARLARYNGGKAVSDMMYFYSTLQNQPLRAGTVELIRRQMRSF